MALIGSIRPARQIRHVAQYMALVDILFATIGIFVIVYALQDLDPPADLRPARYDAMVLCGPDRVIQLHTRDAEPVSYGARDIAGPLTEALENGGRVLIGLSAACATEADGVVLAHRLRELVRTLSDRRGEGDALNLFEVAPIGEDDFAAAALIERFDAVRDAGE